MDRLSSSRKAERRRHSSPYARPAETPRRQRRSTSPETPKSSIIQRARSFLSPLFRGTPSKHEDNDEEEDDEGETEGSGSEMEEDQDEEGSGQEESGSVGDRIGRGGLLKRLSLRRLPEIPPLRRRRNNLLQPPLPFILLHRRSRLCNRRSVFLLVALPPKKPRSQTASALLDILGEAESREPASNDTYVPPTDLSVFLNPYAKEGGATPKKTERKRAEEAAKSHTPKKAERSAIEVIERTAPKPAETEQKKEKSASPAPPNLHSFTPSKTTGTPVGTPSKFEYNKYKPVRSSKLSQGFSVPSPDPVEKVDNNKEEEKTEEVKEKPATPVISFDASAAKPAAAFSFGAPAAVAKKEEEKKEEPAPIAGFSFGAPKTAVPPPAPSFSFGVPAAKPAKEEEAALVTTATSSGFSFKQPTTVSDELNSSVDTSASLFAFKPSSDESAKTSATVSSATISSLVFSKTAEKDVKELAADTDVKGLSSYSFTVLPVADTTSAAAKKALVIPVSELQVYDFTKKAEVIQTQTHQATLSFDWAAAGMKMPQKAVDEWGCDVCLVTNKATADKCISCETPKPAQKTAANTHVSTPSFDWAAAGMKMPQKAVDEWGCDMPQKAVDEWGCDVCLVTNKATADKCISCETPKPAQKTAANTHVSTPSFDWTAAGMKLPQRAADEWECGACMVTNKGDAGRCIACENPKS
ncbi:hypothetical protein SAICODRAFT_69974 [Saitoella complicata NRRL Y-17804]|uniref:uncharacterized protein n=1 Tax=Saitoella complicata (strain BCRC 22490 / CBS 7301 / JCM 7358 / NBRC 10748 / NRRL Y-17804) TaxID=698492 RepID=UPI000866F94C|nr:uncharacterized protein SAICODRAFT_69974 [Saitoella complicata NRRL Y-17804]ODQ54798.1 hypothetical protein SAICODRAFT_69974 [Saitoella complicata NRRL Y-17804]